MSAGCICAESSGFPGLKTKKKERIYRVWVVGFVYIVILFHNFFVIRIRSEIKD